MVFISGTMVFAAPFPDLPADHWATEAVKVLAEKGLVEGYPNGTFKGNRAATRYEVAMVVARLLAYLEKKPQVTKEDLEAIKRLVSEFKDELDAMGVRLNNVETMLASLGKRVSELERVRWSGGFQTRYVSNLVSTCAGCVITPFQVDGTAVATRLPLGDHNAIWNKTDLHNPDRQNPDWEVEGYPFDKVYNVYPTRSGSAVTQLGYLKVEAKLSDEYNVAGVVSMFNNVGQLGNGWIYGSTANTIANPFQAGTAVGGAGAAFFGTAATNLSVNLNQIAVTNDKQRIHLAVGDWRPAYISDHILQGLPNMGVYGPDYLPFYGGQLYGQLQGTVANGLFYEGFAGRLSVLNPAFPTTSPTANFQNMIVGGALAYGWKDASSMLADVKVTGSFLRAQNDSASGTAGATGGIPNPGLWANPVTPSIFGSLNLGGATLGGAAPVVNVVGPQTENLYGAEVKATFGRNWKWLTAWGKYGNSQYQVTRGAAIGVSTATGSMAAGGVSVDNGGKVTGSAEYLWVQPNYDPFIAEVPVPTASFAGPTPAVMWLGFPYPVSYGSPYTTFIGNVSLTPFANGTLPPFTTTTGGASGTIGGGDVFYNLHDSRKYPNNRTGGRAKVNWNYGSGNLGGSFEYLQQTKLSTLPAAFAPGFYEPIFVTVPTALVGAGFASVVQPSSNISATNLAKGYVKTYTGFVDYTTPSKDLTINALYTDNRTKRFAPDFNNIDLHVRMVTGGVTYRPSEKWSLLAGYSQFWSTDGGRYLRPASNQLGQSVSVPNSLGTAAGATVIAPGGNLPANMLFNQKGPYFGANYMFAKGATAWIMYRVYNMKDNTLNNGFAGFQGTQLQSGLRFIF